MNVNLAPIDILKTKNIQIGIISDNNQISTETLKSILQWSNTATMLGIKWDLTTIPSEQNAALVRNYLVTQFLAKPAATHLLFLDGSIGFEPHHILQLLSAEKHIISGSVPKKVFPPDYDIDRTDNMLVEDMCLEVNSVNFDFTLMNKEAFTYLAKHKSAIPFKDAAGELQITYFNQQIIDGRLKTDTLGLCSNWQELGGKIWLQADAMVTKTGPYIFPSQ